MTPDNELLLKLIRAGIGEDFKTEIEPMDETRFLKIYELAKQQTVRGIALAGLIKMYGQSIQQYPGFLKWIGIITKISIKNEKVTNAAFEISDRLRKEGLHPVMIKGQVVAQEYPDPEIREVGDVDFYFEANEGKRAVDEMKSWNLKLIQDFERDVAFEYKGALIELHSFIVHAVHLEDEPLAKKFQIWSEYEMKHHSRKVCIGKNGEEIITTSILMTIIYEFYHLWMHFVKGEGVGLRQLCDWMLCVKNYYGQYDINELDRFLKDFGLIGPWIGFSGILVDYLGLSKECMPFYKKSKKSEKILDIIFKEGNFGKNVVKTQHTNEGLKGIYYRAKEVIGRYSNLMWIFPLDALKFMPGISGLNRRLKTLTRN